MSEHHEILLVEKANGVSGYPWEFMGRVYLLPRELGPNDSLTCDGFYFGQFEPTKDSLGCRTMMPLDMEVLMLA